MTRSLSVYTSVLIGLKCTKTQIWLVNFDFREQSLSTFSNLVSARIKKSNYLVKVSNLLRLTTNKKATKNRFLSTNAQAIHNYANRKLLLCLSFYNRRLIGIKGRLRVTPKLLIHRPAIAILLTFNGIEISIYKTASSLNFVKAVMEPKWNIKSSKKVMV